MSQYYNYKTALLILLMSLIAYLILIIGFYYNDALMGNTPQGVRYILLGIFELLLLLPLFFYVVGNGKSVKHAFRLRPVSILALRDIILVGVGLFFFVELIQFLISALLGAAPANYSDLKVVYPLNLLLLVPVTLIIAPIVEEAIFRGYLLRVMIRSKYSPWISIIVTSLVFALSHLSYRNAPGIFVAGLVLGFVAYSFYSIIPGIIIHSIFNLLVLIDVNIPQIRENILYAKTFVPFAVMTGGLLMLVMGLINIKQNIRVHRRRREMKEGGADEK